MILYLSIIFQVLKTNSQTIISGNEFTTFFQQTILQIYNSLYKCLHTLYLILLCNNEACQYHSFRPQLWRTFCPELQNQPIKPNRPHVVSHKRSKIISLPQQTSHYRM